MGGSARCAGIAHPLPVGASCGASSASHALRIGCGERVKRVGRAWGGSAWAVSHLESRVHGSAHVYHLEADGLP